MFVILLLIVFKCISSLKTNKLIKNISNFHIANKNQQNQYLISQSKIYLFSKLNLNIDIERKPFLSTLGIMFLISAPLGMMLDNQHGLFNVLNYSAFSLSVTIDNTQYLKSAYWVPILFGFAGFVMSAIVLFLDNISIFKGYETTKMSNDISWPKVFYGISLFSLQYYLSGALDYLQYDQLNINIFLSIIAILGFYFFDNTLSGLILALSTAIAGPLAEIILINIFHLYMYTHADIYGICSWIPSVYFLGGPAVGNLARKIYMMKKLKK